MDKNTVIVIGVIAGLYFLMQPAPAPVYTPPPAQPQRASGGIGTAIGNALQSIGVAVDGIIETASGK